MTYQAKVTPEYKEIALEVQTQACGYRDSGGWEEGQWDVEGRSNLPSKGGLQTERAQGFKTRFMNFQMVTGWGKMRQRGGLTYQVKVVLK